MFQNETNRRFVLFSMEMKQVPCQNILYLSRKIGELFMGNKYLLALAVGALMLVACSDDVTEVNEIHQDGMAVLEAGLELSKQKCDSANVGEMLFVMDSSEAFICDGESWQTLKGLDGKDGEKGADGKDGEDGDNGNDGTSCTAQSVKNAAGLGGLEVTCEKIVIDTIWNGEKGENGNDGEDGVGCTLDDEGDGMVTVTCGEGDDATTTILYKAVCGTVAYDPAKSFCSEGTLYSCDDKPYDPAKSFCSEGELYSCGDKPYDPEKQYCLEVTRNETKIYSVEDLLTDSRDNQVYKTVEICNNETSTCQTWMAKNLNYSVNPDVQSWCGGGRDATEGDCDLYGRLYTWAAAVGKSEDECGYDHECDFSDAKNEKGEVRGICPEGWHLPSYDEWEALFTAVGGTSYAGQKLKADSDLWNEGTSNDDSFGFAVLPAGDRNYTGSFRNEGDNARFWSSTEYDSDFAYGWHFYYNYDDVGYNLYAKDISFSVRCLRD